jgi:hypothetical protein
VAAVTTATAAPGLIFLSIAPEDIDHMKKWIVKIILVFTEESL